MLVTLTFLTTPTSDTRGTLLVLQANDQRYMIGNMHEGAQRALIERGSKAIGVTDVFLTGVTEWKNLGGLMGWLLSTADTFKMAEDQAREKTLQAKRSVEELPDEKQSANLKKLASREGSKQRLVFHGGANLTHFIATGRRFIFRKGRPIAIHEYDAPPKPDSRDILPSWQNDQIRVWPMPLSPNAASTFSQSIADGSDLVSGGATNDDPKKMETLQSVVRDMFDSDWRKDDLTQLSLRDVKLPAAVFVRNPQTHGLEQYRAAVPQQPSERPDIQVFVRKPWPGALIPNLPHTQPTQTSMCYLIGVHPPRGRFLPRKAIDLKVPRGPAFSKLANGEAVTAEDGTNVYPEQVMEPPRSGRTILIAELPSVEYVEAFLAREELADTQIVSEIVAAVWILGPGVTEDKRIQEFINQYSEWKHFVSSPDHNADYLTFDSAAESTIRHHLIDPHRFEIPKYDNASKPLPTALAHCHLIARGQKLKIEPDVKLDPDSVDPYLSTGNVVSTFPERVQELAMFGRKDISETLQRGNTQQALPGSENQILTLGTGSALPSKYRNVSSTLLRVPGVGSYLLDCGENTLGQLARIYSSEELTDLLRDLRMIWISHMHADHHLGIVSVLKAWFHAVHGNKHGSHGGASTPAKTSDPLKELKKPGKLFVVSETAMTQYLREYAYVEHYGSEQLILLEAIPRWKEGEHLSQFRWNGRDVGFDGIFREVAAAMQAATGLSDLSVCSVPHCHGARGVAFTFPDGFKLTYSGDARPSQNLVNIGQGSTVLIHEATFDDELQGDAKAKLHSTTSEALGVGVAMKAKRVILTHFSQRYNRIPVMSDITDKQVVLEDTDASNQETPEDVTDPNTVATLAVQDTPSNAADTVMDGTERTTTGAQNATHTVAPDPQQIRAMKVAVAFDSMQVKVKDIELLEKFTPAFMELYKNANERLNVSDADKAEKQLRAKERKALMKEENKKKRLEQQKGSAPKRSKSSTQEELKNIFTRETPGEDAK
jgi:ribonuclease Z